MSVKKQRRSILKTIASTLIAGVAAASAGAQAAPAPIRIAMVESLSGPFANTGEAVIRNLAWAIERVNQRGGISLPGGARPLALERYDSKGQTEEALSALRAAIDDGARIVVQGNSSAVAAALIEAINKHNERNPGKELVFLNYAAVDPDFTNSKCNYWHFRFDADTSMKMEAMTTFMAEQKDIKKVYLFNQNYSHGHQVAKYAKENLARKRPDIQIVGEELHPLAQVRDFAPYIAKIKASGADTVITGNWGSDLALLVKAANEGGYNGKFFTYYTGVTGTPTALGQGGDGRVFQISYQHYNMGGQMDKWQAEFKKRFNDDVKLYAPYVYDALNVMVDAMVKSNSSDPAKYLPALAKTNGYKGVTGTISFDEKGDIKNGALTLYTYKGGKREQIAVVR